MKLSILQQDLLPLLQSAYRSVGVRSTLPVLANVLLQAQGGNLKVSATNLEVGVVFKTKAQTIEDGEACIPAKVFLDTVSSLPGGEISLQEDGQILKIENSNFSATINCSDPSEFPPIPLLSEKSIGIEAKLLKNTLPKITFAAAVDEGRPVLTGILTEIKQGMLQFVATDGFRLAYQKILLENTADFQALVPRRTFEEIVRLIDEAGADSKVEIAVSKNQNQMVFKVGNTEFSSRLIEGQFPAWEKIIPKEQVCQVEIDKGDFLKALKISAVFAKDAGSITKIEVNKGLVTLSSETKEIGGQKSKIEAAVSGEDLTVAFNSRFLIDPLSSCTSEKVKINFSGSLSPALIVPLEEEGLEYIVMPVRLS